MAATTIQRCGGAKHRLDSLSGGGMPPEAQVRKIRRAGRLRSVCFMLLPMLGVLAVALRFPELGAAPTALIALGTAVLACAASRALTGLNRSSQHQLVEPTVGVR